MKVEDAKEGMNIIIVDVRADLEGLENGAVGKIVDINPYESNCFTCKFLDDDMTDVYPEECEPTKKRITVRKPSSSGKSGEDKDG